MIENESISDESFNELSSERPRGGIKAAWHDVLYEPFHSFDFHESFEEIRKKIYNVAWQKIVRTTPLRDLEHLADDVTSDVSLTILKHRGRLRHLNVGGLVHVTRDAVSRLMGRMLRISKHEAGEYDAQLSLKNVEDPNVLSNPFEMICLEEAQKKYKDAKLTLKEGERHTLEDMEESGMEHGVFSELGRKRGLHDATAARRYRKAAEKIANRTSQLIQLPTLKNEKQTLSESDESI